MSEDRLINAIMLSGPYTTAEAIRAEIDYRIAAAKAEWIRESESYADAVARSLQSELRSEVAAAIESRAEAWSEVASVAVAAHEARHHAPTVEPERAPKPKPVPRGHCGRCTRCGWPMSISGRTMSRCTPRNCARRPLPDLRTHCAGCGAPYETSGTSAGESGPRTTGRSGPDTNPQPAVGPEAPQGEAGASVDDEAMRVASMFTYGAGIWRSKLAAEIRAYRDREVARAREECATVCDEMELSSKLHPDERTLLSSAAQRIRALAAKEPKP